jgi:glutathione S-transferase
VTELVFHVAVPEEWAEAAAAGVYERSTRGRSLADVGFVHCSYADQVSATANRFYADLPQVVLLTIDPARLAVPVRPEPAVAGGEEFPHVYSPVPIAAVIAATGWKRGADRVYAAPPI